MNITRLLFALAAVTLTGCASTHAKNPADPLESFNRGVYQFNDVVDKAVAKPVAKGYDAVMPEPGKMMVSNFFSNLDDVMVTANDLLQFKLVQAFSDAGRLLINTTVGAFGLVDIASITGYEKHDEDFGQTLGYWGVESGPYIVLPILGPSSLRDGIGLYADSRPSRLRRVKHMRSRNQLYVAKGISRRAELLEQEKVLDEAVIDRYEFIRDAYLLRRKSLVYDGNPPREKYDDEDEGIDNEQVPIPSMPSSQLENVPGAQPAAVAAKPSLRSESPSVHRVWVAQRTGIR